MGVFHAPASCLTPPRYHSLPVFLSPRLIGRGWDREVGPRWELKMPQALRVYPLIPPLGVRRVLGSTAETHAQRCGPRPFLRAGLPPLEKASASAFILPSTVRLAACAVPGAVPAPAITGPSSQGHPVQGGSRRPAWDPAEAVPAEGAGLWGRRGAPDPAWLRGGGCCPS